VSPLARVTDEQVGDVAVTTVDGEIDASNARELGGRLRSALSNRTLALVVDLSATTYVDSAGINLLFELGLELRQRRQQLYLVVPPDAAIGRMFAIAGVEYALEIHDSREAALAQAAAES
jgi:anti-sigma B factor antagonist